MTSHMERRIRIMVRKGKQKPGEQVVTPPMPRRPLQGRVVKLKALEVHNKSLGKLSDAGPPQRSHAGPDL